MADYTLSFTGDEINERLLSTTKGYKWHPVAADVMPSDKFSIKDFVINIGSVPIKLGFPALTLLPGEVAMIMLIHGNDIFEVAPIELTAHIKDGARSDISELLYGDGISLRAAVPDQDYMPAFPQYLPAPGNYLYPENFPINSVLTLGHGNQYILLAGSKDGSPYPVGATYTFIADGTGIKRFAGNGAGIASKHNYKNMDGQFSVVKAFYRGDNYWNPYGDLVDGEVP